MKKGRYPVDFIGITQGYHVGKTLDFGYNNKYGGPNVPIFASHDGTVKKLEKQPKGGNVVYLEHEDKTVSIYAHLSKFGVAEGDKVKMGEQIGNMGNTGGVFPHLHYGIASNYEDRYKNTSIDPLEVLEAYPNQTIAEGTKEDYGDKIKIYVEPVPEEEPEPLFEDGDKVVPVELVNWEGTGLVQHDEFYYLSTFVKEGKKANTWALMVERDGKLVAWARLNQDNIEPYIEKK